MCSPTCYNITDLNFTSKITASDDYIAGTSFLLTSFIGLVGYSLVLPAIARSKKLRHQCYSLIFSLGVSDTVSLLAWIVIGLQTVTHTNILPSAIIRHSLCILVVGWGSLTGHIGVLAINRYLAICNPEKHDVVFSKRRMIFFIMGCWVYAIFIHAMPTFLPPNMDYTLEGYIAFWYDETITAYYYYEDISWCTCVFTLNLVCYSAIIIRYRKSREQFAALPAKTAAARMLQFRLAIQCVIRCCAFYIYDVLYYVIGYLTQNIWLTFLCSTYLWAFNNALSPWVYLIFDRQLRAAVKRRICGNGSDRANGQAPNNMTIAASAINVIAQWKNRVHPSPDGSRAQTPISRAQTPILVRPYQVSTHH